MIYQILYIMVYPSVLHMVCAMVKTHLIWGMLIYPTLRILITFIASVSPMGLMTNNCPRYGNTWEDKSCVEHGTYPLE